VRIRLHNKRQALVALGKHLGMFDKRHAAAGRKAQLAEVAEPKDPVELAREVALILATGLKRADAAK
jgi:hypothetical protein